MLKEKQRKPKKKRHSLPTGRRQSQEAKEMALNLQSRNVEILLNWPSIVDPLVQTPKFESYNDLESVHQPQNGMPVAQWKSKMVSLGASSIFRQYLWLAISKTTEVDCTAVAFYQNIELNRYGNIALNDLSRVLLRDKLSHEYIHATYVDGYKHKNSYILTQGPLEHTIVDFWRMVWQERACVVVMLTGVVEKRCDKCAIYFPTTNEKDLLAGPFQLSLIDIEVRGVHLLALIKVKCTLTNEQRYTLIAMYGQWPDGWVPEKTCDIISFTYMTKEARASMVKRVLPQWSGHAKGPPMIVHCSAGIGRSATFAVLDICLDMLQHVGRVNVAEVTHKVRAQRAGSIQNGWQYLYLHYAVLKHAKDLGHLNPPPPSKATTVAQQAETVPANNAVAGDTSDK